MAVRPINPQDTLQSGFRDKYNETIGEIITGANDKANGIVEFTTHNGESFEVSLKESFFTKTEVNEALSAVVATGSFNTSNFSGTQLTITHNLNSNTPDVIVWDDSGHFIQPVNYEWQVNDANSLVITFVEQFSGVWKIRK